jgi:uncharacterized protein
MIDYTELLRTASTIAMVGCSGRTNRTSHTIARYLLSNGFRIVPVNPNYTEILQQPCYPSLNDIPEDVHIDVVNVFRNERFAAEVAQNVAEFARARGYAPSMWTQLGVSSPEAEEVANHADVPYVRNRCIMVEHRLGVGHITG